MSAGEKLTVEKKILSWLDDQGYPLELRVAQLLAEKRFHVFQSVYYMDPESGKPREIDAVGRRYSCRSQRDFPIAELEIYCCIECKSSGKPWLVFKNSEKDSFSSEPTEAVLSSDNGKRLLNCAQEIFDCSFLQELRMRLGHGITEAFSNGKDVPFAAVMGAMKASQAKIIEANAAEERILSDPKLSHISDSTLVIPAVAITAPLYQCEVNDSGGLKLKQVDWCALSFQYPMTYQRLHSSSAVYVVTEKKLPQFLEEVIDFENVLSEQLYQMVPDANDCY